MKHLTILFVCILLCTGMWFSVTRLHAQDLHGGTMPPDPWTGDCSVGGCGTDSNGNCCGCCSCIWFWCSCQNPCPPAGPPAQAMAVVRTVQVPVRLPGLEFPVMLSVTKNCRR